MVTPAETTSTSCASRITPTYRRWWFYPPPCRPRHQYYCRRLRSQIQRLVLFAHRRKLSAPLRTILDELPTVRLLLTLHDQPPSLRRLMKPTHYRQRNVSSSSSAIMRTSRSVSLTLLSARRPRPLILRGSVRDKRSVKLSNTFSPGWKRLVAAATLKRNFATVYHEAVFVVMQRLSCVSRNAILLLFHRSTVDNNYARFAFICPVAHFLQPRADSVPDCCKNSGWRRAAILSAVIALVCHAVALNRVFCPAATVTKTYFR